MSVEAAEEVPERNETQFVYLTIPAELYLDQEIFPLAKLLWGRIKTFCLARHKACTASNRFLADELGINERTIRKLLTQLKAHELILVDFKTEEGRTQRRIWALGWDNDPRPYRAATPRPPEAATPRPHSATKDHSNEDQYNGGPLPGTENTESTKLAQQRSPRGQAADAAFGEFWNAVPTKTGKLAASAAYEKARKGGATHEQIMAGIPAYAAYERTRRKQSDYRPLHPATWLNQGRWMDEETPSPGKRPFGQRRFTPSSYNDDTPHTTP